MRLYLADIHLHRARLFRDKEELKGALALLEQRRCRRRKEELEGAEEAAKRWQRESFLAQRNLPCIFSCLCR